MHGTALNYNIFTISIFFIHGPCRLYNDGVISCFQNTALNHHIFAAVRINAVIVWPPVIVQNPDIFYHYISAACHMKGPKGRIIKGHILNSEIFNILQKACTRTKSCYKKRALVKSMICIIICKNQTSLSVNHPAAGNFYIFSMTREEKTASIPSNILIVILKVFGKINHILLIQTGNQHCALLQMQIHIGFQMKRT